MLDQFALRLVITKQSGNWVLDTQAKVGDSQLSAFFDVDGTVLPVVPLQ